MTDASQIQAGMPVHETVIRNDIRCTHCGDEIESSWVNDCKTHKFVVMLAAGRPDANIAADGGCEYLRRVGHPLDWFETSTTELPIDPAEEAAERLRRIRALTGEF
jgi:hypothetical protein